MTRRHARVSPPVGPRRGVRAKIGQLPHLRGGVAPGGHRGRNYRQTEGFAPGAPWGRLVARGSQINANGNYGFVYHLARAGGVGQEFSSERKRQEKACMTSPAHNL